MAFIGIDLGTTTSEASFYRNGKIEMIKNEYSEDITPSFIALDGSLTLQFGRPAKQAYKDVAKEFKRRMGTDEKTRLGNHEYNAIELSSLLLKYIKKYTEDYLGETVDRAVITIPANFTESQRNATLRAGEMAGLKVERIIHEPTAAALAFSETHKELEGKVLVYDLGGGTFDITILDYSRQVVDVIVSEGDTLLGGIDFDTALYNHILSRANSDDGLILDTGDTSEENLKRKRRLELEMETAKINLSFQPQVGINIPYLAVHKGTTYSLDKTVQRHTFEELISALIDKSFQCVEKALSRAKLSVNDIDYVLLVGGSSRIPLVREKVTAMFGQQKVLHNIDPDRAVAIGAGIQAAIIARVYIEDTIIMDVVPHAIGTEVVTSIDGNLISGLFSEIIPANSPMQREFSSTYYTVVENQQQIEVNVFQKASMNNSLFVSEMEQLVPDNTDDCLLSGIPPAPAGEQSVTITFSYNLNGTVDVKAKLDSTGKDIRFSAKRSYKADTNANLVTQTWENSEMARQVQIVQELVNKRLPDIAPEHQMVLMGKLKMMQEAAARNDRATVNKLDDEINTYLFDIS